MTDGSLMKIKIIAECSPLSILQFFWPALSNNLSWKPILVFFLIGRLRQVLLYHICFNLLCSDGYYPYDFCNKDGIVHYIF